MLGVAEAEFERDVEHTVRKFTKRRIPEKPGQGFLSDTSIPDQLPSWLTEEDISYFVEKNIEA